MSYHICPNCHRPHPSDQVVRLGRFDQGRPAAYLARPLGKTFPTRDAAWQAICGTWAKGEQA